MRKLTEVKPWIVREDGEAAVGGRVPADAGASCDEYKQFSMCINCMLCYAACPIYGLDPKFIGPAAIALAQRYNLDSRDQGAAERLDDPLRARGHLGLHVRRRVHQGLPEARRSGRRHPALQAARAALESLKSFFMPRGRAMSEPPRLHAVPPALAAAAHVDLLVAAAPVVSGVHPARAEQRLRRVVRRLPAAAGPRGEPGATSLPAVPRLVRAARSCWR